MSGGTKIRKKDLGAGRHGPKRDLRAVFDRIFSTGRPQGVWSSDDAARRAAARVPVPPLVDRVPLARGDGTVFIPLAGSGLPGQRHIRQATPGGAKARQPLGAGKAVGGVLVRPATQAYWAQGPGGKVHTYPLAPVPEPGPDGRLPTGSADLALGRVIRALRRPSLLLPPGPPAVDDDDADDEAPWRRRTWRPDPLLAHEMQMEARARASRAKQAAACLELGPRPPGRYVANHHLGRNMSPAARAYQQKVTKASAALDYVVVRDGERADFDGYAPDRCVLLDAKLWSGSGKHAQALRILDPQEPKRAPPSPAAYAWALRDVIGPVIDRAQRQARVAGGRPIEWHVSDADTARLLRRLMAAIFRCSCAPGRCSCPIQVQHHPA